MFTFIFGFVVGTAVTGVAFIIFGKNNKNKIAKARAAILEAHDSLGEEVSKFVKGIDKELDKELNKRK